MTEPDLATMLRDHLADEPPLARSGADVLRTARRQTARHRVLSFGAGALAVAAVAALGFGATRAPVEEPTPLAVAQEPVLPLTDQMEDAAAAGFASYVGDLGEPRWSINDVVGDPVEVGDPEAQHFLLDYRPAGTPQVNLTVGGLAPSDWENYQFAGSCDAQLARGALASCTQTTLGDGSLVTVSVGPISGIGGDAPTMLTMADVEGRDPATFAWARVVGIDSADDVAVRASEYVRAADLDDADWRVPVAALRAVALDPAWRVADVAHVPMPLVTDQ